MAVVETWIKTDLKKPVKVHSIGGNLFSQDNMGNLIGVNILSDGHVAEVSGTVSANALRADGATVAVTGTLTGNKASVTLPQAAYAIPGMLSVVIKLTSGSTVTTIGAIQAIVYRSSTDSAVDPGTIIPSVQDLIARIDAAVASIPPDYSALSNQVSTNTTDISGLKTATSDLPTMRTNIAANTEDVSSLKSAISTKAEIDGYYEEMTVGDAEQLIATQFVEDSEPYKFRTTGGSADVGNRAYADKIVGGTIAWNQNIYISPSHNETVNGVTFTRTSDGHVTANGTATADSITQVVNKTFNMIEGHKYVLLGCPSTGSNSTYYITITNNAVSGNPVDSGTGKVFNARGSGSINCAILVKNGVTVSNVVFAPQCFDLTQMFGSNIADAIYTAEQANAGAGVAWFRSLFPEPYYAYNAGELISVSGLESKVTVGFNQWDEEWELGSLTAQGINEPSETRIRTKNYIPCVPNTLYYAKTNGRTIGLRFYDSNKQFCGATYNDTKVDSIFRTAPNAFYIRFSVVDTTTYNNDICINLSWSGTRNGEYEPYQAHSYPLDDSITLRGIPKWVDGKLTFDGDEYLPDGMVNRKYRIVDLGGLSWVAQGTTNTYQAWISDLKTPTNNIICSKYPSYESTSTAANMPDKTVKTYGSSANKYIIVKDSTYTDITAFKSAMSGVYIVYELATPTEETAEPYAPIQIVDDFGTEEYISGSICPVGHETRYPANLRDKLQHLPDLASGNGVYAIQQTGNQMTLIPLTTPTELPTAPTADGTYRLRVTVSNGTPTYAWESEG